MKINDKWKYTAMDESGHWHLYVDKPTLDSRSWNTHGDYTRVLLGVFAPGSFPYCDWKDSLHQIIEGELVKPLKVDDKVMVRDNCIVWRPRYFSHFSGKHIQCFADGRTSWSAKDTTLWDEWRLPTEEEL